MKALIYILNNLILTLHEAETVLCVKIGSWNKCEKTTRRRHAAIVTGQKVWSEEGPTFPCLMRMITNVKEKENSQFCGDFQNFYNKKIINHKF